MSKPDSNEKNHSDTKQTKDRILRAKDIIPGTSKSNSGKNSISAKKHTNVKQNSDIPKFDLAEEILAEQRKITAIRRKAPGRQRELESIGYAAERLKPATFEQEQIITEIVARDIEKLCSGDIIY